MAAAWRVRKIPSITHFSNAILDFCNEIQIGVFLQFDTTLLCISAVQRRVHSTAQSRSCIRNYIRANCQQRWQRFSSLCDSGWLVVVIQYGTGDRILSHLESLQVSQISSLAQLPQSSLTAAALFQVTQSRGFKKMQNRHSCLFFLINILHVGQSGPVDFNDSVDLS